MKREVGEEEVTVTLTRFEWQVMMRGGKQIRNKARRQIEKSPGFVPEPGRSDVNREFIAQFNSAVDKIEAQWGRSLDHIRN
jgi:hypothetical protein